MEFEDWDSFMEPQHFSFGESSVRVGEISSRGEAKSASFVANVATVVLSSAAKAAIPAAAVLWAYQNVSDSTSLCHYKGCCHCESVQFEFQAPRRLKIETGQKQSRYNDVMHRFTKVKVANFEITNGQEQLNTFQVEAAATVASSASSAVSMGTARSSPVADDQGARAFCRRCGVHILHAPSKDSKFMKINITCVSDPATVSSGTSSSQAVAKSALTFATQTAETVKGVAFEAALWMTRIAKDLLQGGDAYKSHPIVQSLLGVGNAILQIIHPYALGSEYHKGGGDGSGNPAAATADKQSSLLKAQRSRAMSSISDDLSSVGSFSAAAAASSQGTSSRHQLFHAAATPKQANSSTPSVSSHIDRDATINLLPSLPQQ
ncbi:unnamed protein product [Cylindrotheca closterium]|uniref:CENP-V/GFA domain-containing protein n=1 Tax=Cylindrotheca closterium TaxID=2856 RepID=A0AAD2FR25_9STRA|nr:unnamed protein product [Cylindrotheca closterium]